ncbi:MAG: right-handed parallel beta-helix repeat-containing protein [Oscillospiraceae bacterium]|nr:right-handed parallel beta-helix repeat-containing protein [Oscillospiraceae bacterium]
MLFICNQQAGPPSADQVLRELLEQIGQRPETIQVPHGKYRLEESHTVPANVTLVMQKGAIFELAAEAELQIFGKVQAGIAPVFTGPGKVTGRIPSEGYVQWFGVDMDDPNGQTLSFQKAVDCLETVLVPDMGKPYALSTLILQRPVTLRGVGNNRVRINVLRDKQYLIQIRSNHIRLENLHFFYKADYQTEEAALYFDTSDRDLEDISLCNVHVESPAYAVLDAQTGIHCIRNVEFDQVHFNSNRNVGVFMTDFTEGIVLRDVCVGSFAYPIPSIGYIFRNIKDMYLENVDVLGGYAKWTVRGGHGMIFEDCENVRSYRIMVDYVNGKQWVMRRCKKMHFSNFVVSLLKEEGLYFEDVTDSVFDVIKSNGNFYDMVNDDPYDSVYLNRCRNLTFNALIIQYNQRDGLILEDSFDNTFNNLVIMENARQSLLEKPGCDRNIFNGLVCNSNKKGGVEISGPSTVIHGYVSNDGQQLPQVTGPYSDLARMELQGEVKGVMDATDFPWQT